MADDRNFDDIAHRFKKNIYDSHKGAVRLGIVWDDLIEFVPNLAGGTPLRILDAGVGMGQMALRLARQGHELVLCDISREMLNQAEALFTEQAPNARVTFIHTPVQTLDRHIGNQTFDLILFHAVLEWLGDPRATLLGLLRHLKPGGHLSLLFYNRNGLVFRHLIRGSFDKLRKNQLSGHPGSLTPTHPLDPEEVFGWLDEAGMERLSYSGVRVFSDYMSKSIAESVALEEVLAMEQRYARVEPYRSLGRYVHVMCRNGGEG